MATKEFVFPNSHLPFDDFILYLNGGRYFNTVEVGTITIDHEKLSSCPTPTTTTIPTAAAPIKKNHREVSCSDILRMCNAYNSRLLDKVDHISTCTKTVLTSSTVSSSPTLIKKDSSVNSSSLTDNEERKLECSKMKIRKRYDEIESEKKRRRIQVIDYHKPLVIDQPQVGQIRAKRAPVPKRQSRLLVRGSKIDSKMFV